MRSYLQYIDLTGTGLAASFWVAIVQFIFLTRWELANVGLVIGTQESVMARVDKGFRQGDIAYSIDQH